MTVDYRSFRLFVLVALLFSCADSAFAECISLTPDFLVKEMRAGRYTAVFSGTAVPTTRTLAEGNNYASPVAFDVDRVWFGRMGKRAEVYLELGIESKRVLTGQRYVVFTTEVWGRLPPDLRDPADVIPVCGGPYAVENEYTARLLRRLGRGRAPR